MRVFVFLASGILEDGSVAFFSYEFISLFETELFFNQSVVFLAAGILEDGFCGFFKRNCFFNESVGFFDFRHFGRRFCGLFFI